MEKRYSTILTICIGMLVMYVIFLQMWIVYLILGIGLLCVFSSRAANLIAKLWMKLGMGLGYINSKVILTIIYVFVLIPLAWLSKLTGNQAVDLKKKEGSYFTERNHLFEKSDFEKPW